MRYFCSTELYLKSVNKLQVKLELFSCDAGIGAIIQYAYLTHIMAFMLL